MVNESHIVVGNAYRLLKKYMLKESTKKDWGGKFRTLHVAGTKDSLCPEMRSVDSNTKFVRGDCLP